MKSFLWLVLILFASPILFIPTNSMCQGTVIKNGGEKGSFPKALATSLEGTLGTKKVRLTVAEAAAGEAHLSFEGPDMNVFQSETVKTGLFGGLKMTFYQSYPGVEGALKHKFFLKGDIGKDGSYSGTFEEVPNGQKGKFSLKPAPPDAISGNYDSPENWMFVQYSNKNSVNFSIGNDWCGVEGVAKLTGFKAHYEKLMKGVLVYIDFDFSIPGKCHVETNANSPEAQEQSLGSEMGNAMKCVPNFTGDYKSKTVTQETQELKAFETVQATAPTATPIPADSDDNDYCTNMSDEAKSKRLDKAEPSTITSSEPDSTVFVCTDKPGPTDHGATGGHCGIRLDTYVKTKGGGLVHNGRWENLGAGYIGWIEMSEWLPSCPDYLFLYTETQSDDGEKAVGNRYIFDGQAKIVGQDQYLGSATDQWVKKDGKYFLWDITGEHISLKTIEMKDIWIEKYDFHYLTTYFSPDLQFASCQLGKNGETTAIYNLEGKAVGKVDLPFSISGPAKNEVLGLTNAPQIIGRNKDRIVLIDLKGNQTVKMFLPKYPHRDLATYMGHGPHEGEFRTFEYEANTNTIKDYPRPEIKIDLVHWTATESLDGEKTWHPIDLRTK